MEREQTTHNTHPRPKLEQRAPNTTTVCSATKGVSTKGIILAVSVPVSVRSVMSDEASLCMDVSPINNPLCSLRRFSLVTQVDSTAFHNESEWGESFFVLRSLRNG